MDNVLALVAATMVLILLPGPNVALIVAVSLKKGLRPGLVTAFGTTLGIGLQLALVVVGMTTLIESAASALQWIKWLGVVYLLYLGITTMRAAPDDFNHKSHTTQSRTFARGVLLALINPKTLLFNAAFLPQFVSTGGDPSTQLMSLSAVFLFVVMIGDVLWALFAASARAWIKCCDGLRNRLTGSFLLGAGVALALSKRSS